MLLGDENGGGSNMDFVRLAIREVKRNGSRTAIGIAAMALATVILVLSRIVPQGYMRNQAIAERIFADADILVWPAPAHVYAEDSSALEWREWEGAPWQSFAEYFIPTLSSDGYVCPFEAPPWRPLHTQTLSELLAGVDGIAKVEPYLAYPCKVTVGDITEEAILRGREPDDAHDPLALVGQVEFGRGVVPEDIGTANALVPFLSEPYIPYLPGGDLRVFIPSSPVDRADGHSAVLTMIGAYVVEIGEVPGLPKSPKSGYEPEFWKRPEVIVSVETFKSLVGKAVGSSENGLPGVPVHQLLVRVSRPSEMREVVERIRKRLGPDYAVFSVAELADIRAAGGGQQIVSKDMSPIVTAMIVTMAGAIVVGSVYVLLALQTRKLGLMRAIGATSRNIVVYALSVIGYTTLIGAGIGFVVGKLVTLSVLLATDFTFAEWLRMTAVDALLALSSLGISLGLGLAVAVWASRIPCAEVLRRE
jgi:hypothetical protein